MPLLVRFAVLGHDEISVLIHWQLWLAFVELHKGMVGVAEDADGVSLQIADVLEQKLPSMLPEDVILVLEQAVFDHLCLILAHQKLLDLVRVPHPHCLRLFQRVHEVEVGGLAHIADHWIWLGIVLVVEAQAPRCFVAFLLEADSCVKLHPDGHVPLEWP